MQIVNLLFGLCLAVPAMSTPLVDQAQVAAAPKEEAGSRRRGIAYNNPDFARYFYVQNSQVGWTYNWDSTTKEHGTNFEYIPMLWGNTAGCTSKWWDAVNHAAGVIKANPTHLLSFNEPDNCMNGAGGSCMRVEDAVGAWWQYMEPAKAIKDKMYLGSPAVTNGGPGMGLEWLNNFMKACSGCNVDFICIHWYDKASNVQYFKDHINRVRDIANGRPIWITELGPQGTDDEIKAFLNEVIPWMDNSGDIHRYAYFMAREGLLINRQGDGMSDIGRHFAYWRSQGNGFTTEPGSSE